ncbi:PREDICTED: p21-activated protein kinase-interacting protein 1-like [Ceratosolen solmsi marchali]|uniref:P21-activated protein kinase-interacting protein 1-like n=1 Tax=Ceratosolen solmsi marchali TaxID=326594 RepID=A0AAJ7DY64_9HYME|nr:PREDICTED: p21-activated protein kinase-interacting protein 1-like [Ceratosolen solmsi marchali]
MAPNLEVIVGTYEQFLLGYTVDDVVNEYKMEQSFATRSHFASIRSVASNKSYLASAAADDTVCLFDMNSRMESGKLTHHSDTVNSISFTPDASHIITVSSDGTIGIIRCGNWQMEKHWLKPHKGLGVDTLAVHPTGKIAMTTGRDGVLRTWNLVKGRQAYATNLVPRWKIDAKNISVLKWSPNGECYLLAANNRIDIYSVESAGIEEELSFNAKVICVEYLDDNYIAVGLADGKISIYNLQTQAQTSEIQAHDLRVKCLAVNGELLVSASSSGEIKLWSFNDESLILLNAVDCNARISCLTLTSCLNLKHRKEEANIEEVVSEKLPNKLRSKQRVVIEDEGNDENKSKRAKRKRNKKILVPICDDANCSGNTITENVKKIKTNKNENSMPTKRKGDTTQLPLSCGKKTISDFNKKRKQVENLVDKDSTELSIKKKKQKGAILEKIGQAKDKQNSIINKKKRKNTEKDRFENLEKKQKICSVENVLLKRKRKKN